MDKLYIIGMGPGDEALLTGEAKSALEKAQRIHNTREIPLSELMETLKNPENTDTALLVSGDSGFYSVAKTIIKDFSDIYEIEVLPGIGSIPYLSAKLKTTYDDALLVSLHGRSGNIVPKVAYNKRLFALTGGANTVSVICSQLSRYGLGGVSVNVGERLSFPDERIITGRAEELDGMDFDALSVVFIENPSAANPQIPLSDSDFMRTDIPMTKEEVRWLSIQKLGINPQDIVYDIGAGTGSVSIEMARKAYEGFVCAIEAKIEACDLVRANAAKHGAFNMEIIHGMAPEAIETASYVEWLRSPDKAFIGGSSGNMDGIIEKLLQLNPDIRIAANAITLQTLNEIITGFEKHGITNTDIICVNIAKSKKAGSYDMMMAQNPVYIITGSRN